MSEVERERVPSGLIQDSVVQAGTSSHAATSSHLICLMPAYHPTVIPPCRRRKGKFVGSQTDGSGWSTSTGTVTVTVTVTGLATRRGYRSIDRSQLVGWLSLLLACDEKAKGNAGLIVQKVPFGSEVPSDYSSPLLSKLPAG